MKRGLKWLGLGLAGLVGMALVAVAVLYGASEVMLRARQPKAARALVQGLWLQ